MAISVMGVLFLIVIQVFVIDWYVRLVFLSRVYCRKYGHGKSWKRARKHYKSIWTFFERILWIPMFAEKYEKKHRSMAYQAYAHYGVATISIICFLLDEFMLTGIAFWQYIFAVLVLLTLFRYIYSDHIAVNG